ncbi:glycosyltransferase family 4 protein [Roseomonas sp. HF4]|uniref:glycosyltransferase family 4 protein n=1 Tax=Roseomonas sp. HF4 TaxID=2562313 RepID=UPI0010C06330|nr:glycosyltransferase family 4 protein [Roseomonas sp. HF4]
MDECGSETGSTRMASPRYAWVLSGAHPPRSANEAPRPRAEFQAFLARFGGELLSLSSPGKEGGRIPKLLRRLGWPRLGLAALVLERAHGFDAILASGEDIGIPLALLSLTRRSRIPIHMMFHGHHLESRKLRLLAPVLRRLGHVHFHCLSESLRARTQSVLGIPDARCHATGYGVDTHYFAGAPFAHDGPIASAGAANRDYTTLAAATRELPVDLRIAADSTWVPVAAAGVPTQWPANVEIRSYGDYAGLRELYRRARFVVVPLHPARHACGYAVIAEAMAMSRAVVATRTEVPPDFLVPGITGLFTQPHDVKGLRSTIRHLLDHPEAAAAMGRNARAGIEASHSLEGYCDRLEKLVAGSIVVPDRSAGRRLQRTG